jgi:hypothetical protein
MKENDVENWLGKLRGELPPAVVLGIRLPRLNIASGLSAAGFALRLAGLLAQ